MWSPWQDLNSFMSQQLGRNLSDLAETAGLWKELIGSACWPYGRDQISWSDDFWRTSSKTSRLVPGILNRKSMLEHVAIEYVSSESAGNDTTLIECIFPKWTRGAQSAPIQAPDQLWPSGGKMNEHILCMSQVARIWLHWTAEMMLVITDGQYSWQCSLRQKFLHQYEHWSQRCSLM